MLVCDGLLFVLWRPGIVNSDPRLSLGKPLLGFSLRRGRRLSLLLLSGHQVPGVPWLRH